MSPTSTQQILKRRRSERTALIARAKRFADALDSSLDVRAVVVFGSVARGDFNSSSDVDVLVIADHLPGRILNRNDALGVPPPRVSFVAWTIEEWSREKQRRNPIVLDVEAHGVILSGELP
ncbi:MAG TPA: nucleotidyltransferase domain-containing protein [Acidimicrobiia bacterium]|nr:nucleotidyltransferase domain-containing protein [Acidimicrobiia bacterium]